MFRISLTYDEPIGTGKTTAHMDMGYGRFYSLWPFLSPEGLLSRRSAMWHGETPATTRGALAHQRQDTHQLSTQRRNNDD
ncbi:MAG: hypothetical protein H6669_16070 [Ardenticatenaceae bacterium]|nr:hypothetical protein [Ardenticatenaceae bacterium]